MTGIKSITNQSRVTDWRKEIILIIICIVTNIAGSLIAAAASLPVYLDSIGTVVGGAFGGYMPGVIIGLITNVIKMPSDPSAIYYASLNVLIAVTAARFAKKGYMRKISGVIGCIFVLALIGGGIGSLITWFIYGFAGEGITVGFVQTLYDTGKLSPFAAQITADFLIDLLDKTITVLIVLGLRTIIPHDKRRDLRFYGWQQTPLSDEAIEESHKSDIRRFSLRKEIIVLLIAALLAVGISATAISYRLYYKASIDEHTTLGQSVARLAASAIDGNRVDEFISEGESAEGYSDTENMLYEIRRSSSDIEYIYAYKIEEDGCHVVFDLDTLGEPGADPGEIISFDESFAEYIPDLLAGKEIEPVTSDDTYGWLLTAYAPVYNDAGETVCYAAADISMNRLRSGSYTFFAKLIAIFFGVFVLILVIGIWLVEYHIVLPISTMTLANKEFAYNSEGAIEDGVERIRALDIHTGDEIENLYKSVKKTSEDSMAYVADIQKKTETIEQMQYGLIMVLADLVESRDKNTGQHVKKTAEYTKIIMDELRREGKFKEQLTDDFIETVYHSAPLHDVGKIKVPDAILNKDGKLTDEEFAIMKSHTTAGMEILTGAIEMVPESKFLYEARDLAAYHHEKWDGTGYPTGLSGEDIPLSARIMAVADVFDALVSKRSYKPGFPIEKALGIIEEGIGSHFDPDVAQAFLNAEEEVRKVASQYDARNDE